MVVLSTKKELYWQRWRCYWNLLRFVKTKVTQIEWAFTLFIWRYPIKFNLTKLVESSIWNNRQSKLNRSENHEGVAIRIKLFTRFNHWVHLWALLGKTYSASGQGGNTVVNVLVVIVVCTEKNVALIKSLGQEAFGKLGRWFTEWRWARRLRVNYQLRYSGYLRHQKHGQI